MVENINMSNDWQQLTVLVAGCGSIGRRHLRVLHELGVSDLHACDPTASAREAVSEELPAVKLLESYEAGLEISPDAVFICTPPKMHVSMAQQAICSGCHVFMEKPVSDTLDGVDELAAQAERSQKKLMVGLCFRYHEGVARLREHFDAGRLGRLVCIRSLMGEHLPDVRPDYRDLFSAKYNGAFDLVHDVDLALWFADQPVRRIQSLFGNYSDIGIEAPDMVELLIDFEDRSAASVHLDFFQRPRRRQFELIGTDGVLTLEFASWDRCIVSIYESQTDQWQHEELTTDRDNMFRAEDKEFLAAVAKNLPLACTLEEGLKSLRVILTAQQGAPVSS